jgi:hypothetical protein
MEGAMTDTSVKLDKQPRFRSPPYPSIPLGKAIERASALYLKALHHPVPIAVPASAWDYAEKSSGLFATLAALKQFGLLVDDGSVDKRRFKLTDAAIRIVRDQDPASEKRKSAVRTAALSPKIHTELWEKYGTAGASGSMDISLKSYLTLDRSDDGAAPYSDSAAEDLIAEYRQTLAFAGLLEDVSVPSGIPFDVDTANLKEADIKTDSPTGTTGSRTELTSQVVPSPVENAKLNDIRLEFFDGKVRISALLDKDGLEELQKKIDALKFILS